MQAAPSFIIFFIIIHSFTLVSSSLFVIFVWAVGKPKAHKLSLKFLLTLGPLKA